VRTGRKVDLVVEGRVIGVIKDKEPALLRSCEHVKRIRKALDRGSQIFGNRNKIALGSGRLINVDPEDTPEPVTISWDSID
jgi:hypothetical protein